MFDLSDLPWNIKHNFWWICTYLAVCSLSVVSLTIVLVEIVPLMPLFAFFFKLQDGPCGSEKEFCKKYSYYDYPIEGMFCFKICCCCIVW